MGSFVWIRVFILSVFLVDVDGSTATSTLNTNKCIQPGHPCLSGSNYCCRSDQTCSPNSSGDYVCSDEETSRILKRNRSQAKRKRRGRKKRSQKSPKKSRRDKSSKSKRKDRKRRRRRNPKPRNAEPALRLSSVRSLDGSGDDLGAEAGSTLLRMTEINYPDHHSSTVMREYPNPRTVSQNCLSQNGQMPNARGLSDFVWAFGQFLDHDLGITPGSNDHQEQANVVIENEGDVLGPVGTELEFSRAAYHTTSIGTREFTNEVTSVIDASMVYGSNQERADALRLFQGGKLLTSAQNKLPLNKNGLPNEGGDSRTDFALAGDIRANEQFVLTAFHTLFVREHNRLCDRILGKYPKATDDEIYQLARKIVGMEMQKITYEEFLPALLGSLSFDFRKYRGYNPATKVGISAEFSGAGFRFGHSMVSSQIILEDAKGRKIRWPLRSAFFSSPSLSRPRSMDNILRGLRSQRAQEVDIFIVDDLRNALFGRPGMGGTDLASMNIQRGRDLGLPSYNEARSALGLIPNSLWSEVTSDNVLARKLESVYQTPDELDLWVGALAEDHVPGSSAGELLGAILVDQFDRLMHGDKYFHLNDPDLTAAKLEGIVTAEEMRLSDVIRYNTGASFPAGANVFFTNDEAFAR